MPHRGANIPRLALPNRRLEEAWNPSKGEHTAGSSAQPSAVDHLSRRLSYSTESAPPCGLGFDDGACAQSARRAGLLSWRGVKDSVRSLARWRSRRQPAEERSNRLSAAVGSVPNRGVQPSSALGNSPRVHSNELAAGEPEQSEGFVEGLASWRGGSEASTARSGLEGERGRGWGAEDCSDADSASSSLEDSASGLVEGRKPSWMLFRRRRAKLPPTTGGHRRNQSVGSGGHRRAAPGLPGVQSDVPSTPPRDRLPAAIRMAARHADSIADSRSGCIRMDPRLGAMNMDQMFALMRPEAAARGVGASQPVASTSGPALPVSRDLNPSSQRRTPPGHDRRDSGQSWGDSGYMDSESGTEITPASPPRAPESAELPDVDEDAELVVVCNPWIGLEYERTLRHLGRRPPQRVASAGPSGSTSGG
eukprot:evm.model.scf_893.6 EVM.evm.TU.scf_893.6   scf_893:50589-51851(-)